YDTPELDLHRAGIITRARRVVGDRHDSTVKFRPVIPDQVASKWRTFRDFKIEADASEKGVTKSASFSMPVAKGVIKRIAAGDRPIVELFTKDQQTFLLGMANRNIDFSRMLVFGPLRAHRWKFEDPGCPWPITAEVWVREDGARLMEASIKAPVVQAAAALAGFMAFLAEFGAERDMEEQAKTRWALEYYAAKVRKSRDGGAGRGARAGERGGGRRHRPPPLWQHPTTPRPRSMARPTRSARAASASRTPASPADSRRADTIHIAADRSLLQSRLRLSVSR